MQNNIFNRINMSTRILILILLCLSLFITSSIYFLIFLSIFTLILLLLTNKSVKFYIDLIKKIKSTLLFVFIIYIIIIGSVVNSFIFVYKVILFVFLLEQFKLTMTFETFTNGIKTLLNRIIKAEYLDDVSYNIAIFTYFVDTYFKVKEEIKLKHNKKLIYFNLSLKNNVLPRLFLSIHKTKKLESSLKLKFYEPRLEEKSIKSNLVLTVFLVLFIIVVFKEVIL